MKYYFYFYKKKRDLTAVFFKHFQTLASFSCKAQWAIFQCPLNTACTNYRGADDIKHFP